MNPINSPPPQPVTTGLEQLLKSPPESVSGRRLGLLCNPASVDPTFQHARDLIHRRFPGQLRALFSPQHGFFSEKQDNMIESAHGMDGTLGIPIFSLYGETRIPTQAMFEAIDTLVVDLQDAGTRVYTFIYTLSHCMEAARRHGKQVIVLDRPNPIGGERVEGNCLSPAFASFVGRYPIPMRHGLTIGELARLFNEAFGIGCDLAIVPMSGWRRAMGFEDTGLPWVAPSPNLPTPASAAVYPGQVIWEGTCLSEGRGTTQPFELFGAPFLDPEKILRQLTASDTQGVHLRPAGFEPTSNKWRGILCRGFQIHVTDRDLYRPYRLSLSLLRAVIALHRKEFSWKAPPYEYEYERLPIDLILGSRQIRERIEALEPIDKIEGSWQDETNRFERLRQRFLLY
jgi:uncharacterized protein YbbC (DUF1343 family)